MIYFKNAYGYKQYPANENFQNMMSINLENFLLLSFGVD